MNPLLLWIKTGPLHPLDTGGKIRTHGMLRALRRHCRIHFVALRPAGTPQADCMLASDYSDAQTWIPHPALPGRGLALLPSALHNLLFSRLPLSIARYRNPKLNAAVERLLSATRSEAETVLLCDFLTPSVNLLPKSRLPRIPTLLFQHNVESAIWRRLAAAEQRPLHRLYLRDQASRMERFEAAACTAFDGIITVSPADSRSFREEFGCRNVLGDVPTGVDTDYYRPDNRQPEPDRLAFLGSMDWMPNIDAVLHFARDILPRIVALHPGARLSVIGRNPTPAIRQLARDNPSIEVTGTVEDVRPHLARAAALVVPLRAGGGTRIKIFEAAAAGLPVISTPVGAEGLPMEDGIHLRIAHDPDTFARATAELLANPTRAEALARAARALVESRFGWQAVADRFAELVAEGAARARAGRLRENLTPPAPR